jgi:hypothetical protein
MAINVKRDQSWVSICGRAHQGERYRPITANANRDSASIKDRSCSSLNFGVCLTQLTRGDSGDIPAIHDAECTKYIKISQRRMVPTNKR